MAADGQADASAFDIGAVHAETREGAKHLAAVVGGYARSFVAVIESAQVRWHRLNYDDTDVALVPASGYTSAMPSCNTCAATSGSTTVSIWPD